LSQKNFAKNHKFLSKITFSLEIGDFQDGLGEVGCRDLSRMKEGKIPHLLIPMRAPPTAAIKRYDHFSDRQFRRNLIKIGFLDFVSNFKELIEIIKITSSITLNR